MFSYQFYKTVHIIGIILLYTGFGVTLTAHLLTKAVPAKAKILGFATHGLGLTFILVSGFGMAARLGLFQSLPTWVYAKLVIWGILGMAISLAKRKAQWPLIVTLILVVLGSTAAYIGVNKI